MSVVSDRVRSTIERLIHSPRFVVLSSVAQFVIDMATWSLTAIAASYARFEYQGHHDPFGATKSSVFRVLPIVLIVHAIVGYIVGIYRRRWRYGSFDEVGGLVLATFITTSVLQVVRFFDDSLSPFPRSVIVIAGFAGGTADAFTLFERFESQLEKHHGQLVRSAVELAKEWRSDRALRKLEAMLVVANEEASLIISGTGDVIQPTDGIIGIGSGGNYAIAAARALRQNTDLKPVEIVRKALEIAGGIDIYTNQNIVVEEIPCQA